MVSEAEENQGKGVCPDSHCERCLQKHGRDQLCQMILKDQGRLGARTDQQK